MRRYRPDLPKNSLAGVGGGTENSFRQSLQVNYVRRLIDVYESKNARYDLARPIVYAELSSLRYKARKRSGRGDAATKASRLYITHLVDDAFNRFSKR